LTAIGELSDCPSVFDRTELRRASEHLRAGRILAMAVEGGRDRHLRLVKDGYTFDMATGVLRLAALTGAVVIPCLITAGPNLSFTVHLGDPVPEELVLRKDLHLAACEHLFHEFLQVVERNPGQSLGWLLEQFQPAAVGLPSGAEELSGMAS
jgi:lauroyl/myristoyl acyltransferase